MLKIEFDPSNKPLAAAIGAALTAYGRGDTLAEAAIANKMEADTVAPKLESSAASAVGSNVAEHQNSQTSEETPSETTATESESPAADVGSKGYPIHDLNGVPHDKDFCGKAAEPFYKEGNKRAGKWKKKVGVSDSDYDAWYEEQLHKLSPAQARKDDEAQGIESPSQKAFQPTEETPELKNVAADFGSLTEWMSEKQTAGLLESAQIVQVYKALGTTVAALISPANTQGRADVHAALVEICGE